MGGKVCSSLLPLKAGWGPGWFTEIKPFWIDSLFPVGGRLLFPVKSFWQTKTTAFFPVSTEECQAFGFEKKISRVLQRDTFHLASSNTQNVGSWHAPTLTSNCSPRRSPYIPCLGTKWIGFVLTDTRVVYLLNIVDAWNLLSSPQPNWGCKVIIHMMHFHTFHSSESKKDP